MLLYRCTYKRIEKSSSPEEGDKKRIKAQPTHNPDVNDQEKKIQS